MAEPQDVTITMPLTEIIEIGGKKSMICVCSGLVSDKLYFLKDSDGKLMGGFASLPVMRRYVIDNYPDCGQRVAIENAIVENTGVESIATIPVAPPTNELKLFGGEQDFGTWHYGYRNWMSVDKCVAEVKDVEKQLAPKRKRRKVVKKTVFEANKVYKITHRKQISEVKPEHFIRELVKLRNPMCDTETKLRVDSNGVPVKRKNGDQSYDHMAIGRIETNDTTDENELIKQLVGCTFTPVGTWLFIPTRKVSITL